MNSFPPHLHCFVAWLFFLGATIAHAQVNTYFTDKHGTFNGIGDYWYQEFSLTASRSFVLRVTSDYVADTAIVTPAQLSNFTNNLSFSGYALFDNKFGTTRVTLPAGTYYLAIRSQSSTSGAYRVELDHDISLPADGSYSYTFVDNGIQGSKYVGANGGRMWHGFTIQSGYRYFLDGCNTGLSTYVIPASELNAFTSGASFNYYSDYSGTDNAYPGLHEIKLPAGSYYLAFHNSNTIDKPVTYTMERWRQNPVTPAGQLDMSGASWKAAKGRLNIKVAKVVNRSSSGRSGSLRLRLWACRSKFSGGTLSGHILGTRNLNPLSGGYQYTNIKGRVSYQKPPSGRYRTVLTLEEHTVSGWVIRDYINFNGLTSL